MKRTLIFSLISFLLGVAAGVVIAHNITGKLIEQKASALFALGTDCQEKDINEAISFFYQSIALTPDWYAPHLGLALAYKKKHDAPLALKEFKKARDLIHKDECIATYDRKLIAAEIMKLQTEAAGRIE